MSKHIELAKKLKSLADGGVGGEKTNAETLLNALMAKHKITIEDIEGEKTEDYCFNLSESEHRLWFQVVKVVNHDIKCYGKFPKSYIKKLNLKGNYMITCTASEYIEIEAKYNFYNKLYIEESNVFYSAFLQANNLLVDNPNRKSERKLEDITMSEFLEFNRINEMAKKIKIGQFNKQISK